MSGSTSSPALDALRADRDALLAVRRSGVTRTTSGSSTVQYQTGAEMDAALARMDRDIARLEQALTGTPRRAVRQVVFIAGKGL